MSLFLDQCHRTTAVYTWYSTNGKHVKRRIIHSFIQRIRQKARVMHRRSSASIHRCSDCICPCGQPASPGEQIPSVSNPCEIFFEPARAASSEANSLPVRNEIPPSSQSRRALSARIPRSSTRLHIAHARRLLRLPTRSWHRSINRGGPDSSWYQCSW